MTNTEQLTELVKGEVRSLNIHPDAEKHIDTAIEHVRSFLQEHMPTKQLRALEEAKLTAQDWKDLKAICSALNNKQVQNVGRVVLEEARANLLAGPAEVGKKVVSKLHKSKLRTLMHKV